MKLITAIVIALFMVLCLTSHVVSHSNGAPRNHLVCKGLYPHHGMAPQKSPPPYSIESKNPSSFLSPVEITLVSKGNDSFFKGFILQVRQDSGMPIGTFKIMDEERSKPLSCYSDNDTVTHSNPLEKTSISFKWIPPTNLKGTVHIYVTFVKVYTIFWIRLKKEIVIGNPGNIYSNISFPSDLPKLSRTTLQYPTISLIQRGLYEGCGVVKKCFGMPGDCVSWGSCDAMVSIVVRKDIFEFEMIGTGSDYVAVGLSDAQEAGYNSVTECLLINNNVELYHSPKYFHEPNRSILSADSEVALVNSSYNDGTIYCKFVRKKITDINVVRYNLKTIKYYLTLAMGSIRKGYFGGIMAFDSIKFKSSENNMDLSDTKTPQQIKKKTTQGFLDFGSWIINFYIIFILMI